MKYHIINYGACTLKPPLSDEKCVSPYQFSPDGHRLRRKKSENKSHSINPLITSGAIHQIKELRKQEVSRERKEEGKEERESGREGRRTRKTKLVFLDKKDLDLWL